MDPVKFVESLKIDNSLPKSTSTAEVKFVGGVRQAAVVAGSIVAFTDALTAQEVEDVTNSTLFVQILDGRQERHDHPSHWYQEYVRLLNNFGFIGIELLNIVEYQSTQSHYRLDQVVFDLLKPSMTQAEGELAGDAIAKLGSGEIGPIKLFASETMTSSDAKGNFQVILVDKDAHHGTVGITFGAFYFTAAVKSDRFLWDTWDKTSLQLFYGVQKVVLNEPIYGKFRDYVKKVVAPYLPEKVASIPL